MSTQPDIKFLLVDDDNDSRATVHEFLTSFGYQNITSVTGVAEAIQVLNTAEVDFVISDWDMPGASGFSLIKLIKLQERFKSVSCLIVSGPKEHEENKVKKAAALGVDGYLLKPFRLERFKAVLEEIMKRRALTKTQ